LEQKAKKFAGHANIRHDAALNSCRRFSGIALEKIFKLDDRDAYLL
jgi:hypothetical protein